MRRNPQYIEQEETTTIKEDEQQGIQETNNNPNNNNNVEIQQEEVNNETKQEVIEDIVWWDGSPLWLGGTVSRGLTCGLRNVGNSCYMSSTLQALGQCTPLACLFVVGWPFAVHPGSVYCVTNYEPRNNARWRFTESFAWTMRRLWSGEVRDFGPRDVTRSIIETVPEFRTYGQQDAHEAICYMLNNLHEEVFSPVPSEMHPAREPLLRLEREREFLEHRSRQLRSERVNRGGTSSSPAVTKRDEPFFQVTLPYQKSVVSDNCYSLVSQTVTCSTCGQKSLSLDELLFLQLALPTRAQLREVNRSLGRANSDDSMRDSPGDNGSDSPPLQQQSSSSFGSSLTSFSSWFPSLSRMQNAVFSPNHTLTLEECLRFHFNAAEKIEYQCMCCDAKRDASLRLELEHVPEILFVQLKRFNKRGGWGLGSAKNSTQVRFPVSGLDLSEHFSKQSHVPPGGATYDLFAIVRHTGGIESGHYISVCMSRADGNWYEYDDEFVTRSTTLALQSPDAYLLFYSRRPTAGDVGRHNAMRAALSLNPSLAPSKQTRFVSLAWVLRFETVRDPGPVDNSTFSCPHGKVAWPAVPHATRRALAIPLEAYERLIETYGRSAATTMDVESLEPCATCREEWESLSRRRNHEFERWLELTKVDEGAGHAAPQQFFALSMSWFLKWKAFVQDDPGPYGRGGFLGSSPPGQIDQSRLFTPTSNNELLRRNLRNKVDFHFIGPQLWGQLVSWYGGGPEVATAIGVRDIYSGSLRSEEPATNSTM